MLPVTTKTTRLKKNVGTLAWDLSNTTKGNKCTQYFNVLLAVR